jgi:hypothetical protein
MARTGTIVFSPDNRKKLPFINLHLLRLDSWTGKDGRERSGLRVAAAKIEVLGRIGFDPSQRRPTETRAPLNQPELEGHGCREGEDLSF